MRYSILQENKECYVCGSKNVHIHEIFYGKNRQKSIKDGCCVYLCPMHHNMSNAGVHFNHKLDIEIKQKMQVRWCKYYDKTNEDFIKRFGKNYLEIS